ncbi:hypothetical protein FOZ63_025028, partial [Perkinsus olseni]
GLPTTVIYATTYEDELQLNHKYTKDVIDEHKSRLIELGHKVYHSVDATNITTTLITRLDASENDKDITFDRIIFMHPLVCIDDKVRCGTLVKSTPGGFNIINMLMLMQFLISSSKYICSGGGEVWITIK